MVICREMSTLCDLPPPPGDDDDDDEEEEEHFLPGDGGDGGELERRRSRLCLVCGGDAESYHLNYGASACLSCRAFFRRSVDHVSLSYY